MSKRRCTGPCQRRLKWPDEFPKDGFTSSGTQRWRSMCKRCWRFRNRQRALLRQSVKRRVREVDDYLHQNTRGIR